jgi:hypothetical protein
LIALATPLTQLLYKQGNTTVDREILKEVWRKLTREQFPLIILLRLSFSQRRKRMRTIETTATVTNDGKMTVQIPPDIPEGEHRVVVVIEEQPVKKEKRPPLDLPAHDYGPWPADLSLRREDMYDDWGR